MSRELQPRKVRIIRYRLPDGSSCKKDTPDAIKHTEQSSTYYACIDRKRISLKTADLDLAWERLRKLLRKRREEELGIHQPEDDWLERTFEQHLDDWLATVRDKGTTPEHPRDMRRNVLAVREAAKWKNINDIDLDSATAALSRLMAERGIGPQTRNHMVDHLRQFTRWLSRGKKRRLTENPLEALGKISVETDLRRQRRPPTDDEVAQLFAYLYSETAAERRKMSGPQRALGYKVCMATGLRSSELRSLERSSFDLDAGEVSVKGAYSKHRRQDVQPLPPWLVEELREWFAAGGGVWRTKSRQGIGLCLQADLRAAGVPSVIDTPTGQRWLDMHSFRIFYCSALASQPGISPKVLMHLCRHSSANLTLKVYSRVQVHQARAAVDALPRPGDVAPGVAAETRKTANHGDAG